MAPNVSIDHQLRVAVERMRGYPHCWAIAGGWAIDLFVGRVSRSHADVDIATLRVDQHALRQHLAAATVAKVEHHTLGPWRAGQTLVLPVHEVHATWPDGTHLELLLNESDGADSWVFRRDARVRLPMARALLARDAIPFLAPEIALLFKSNDPSPKNDGDFVTAVAQMSNEQRVWLRDAIALGSPEHPWVARLTSR